MNNIEKIKNKGPKLGKFKCKCGKEFVSSIGNVKHFNVTSCGCRGMKNNLKHGLSNHSLYGVWRGMKVRCLNKEDKNYDNYGGRGITMKYDWIFNFKPYYDYVMSLDNAMVKGLTINRINNDKGYYPGNLEWSTWHEQLANRRPFKLGPTEYTGVYYRSKNNYQSAITVNYKYISIGYYNTPKAAVIARNDYIINNALSEYPIQNL